MAQIPLSVLVAAREALRQVKDAPADTVPAHLWRVAMTAHSQLDHRIEQILEREQAPVEVQS
jgi:hypothetical protein